MLKHTQAFFIITIMSLPSFATDISGGETCDTDVLNTDIGPVNLRAEFEPETIDLRWYNNNTLLNVTSTNSNTCTYDTSINLPANPTKPGYKFKGWNVRPEYDFSTLDATITGNAGFCKSVYNGNDSCRQYDETINYTTCNNQNFKELNRFEWKIMFNYGAIYGMGKCTPSDATAKTVDNYEQSSGTYCWCKATGYIPTNSNIKYAPSNPVPWVLYASAGSIGYCNQQCACYCAWMLTHAAIGDGAGNCPNCIKNLFGISY